MKRDLLLFHFYLIPFAYIEVLWENNGHPYGYLAFLIPLSVLAFFHKSVIFFVMGLLLSYVSSEVFLSLFKLEEYGIFQPFRVWEIPRMIHVMYSPILVLLFFLFRLKKYLSS